MRVNGNVFLRSTAVISMVMACCSIGLGVVVTACDSTGVRAVLEKDVSKVAFIICQMYQTVYVHTAKILKVSQIALVILLKVVEDEITHSTRRTPDCPNITRTLCSTTCAIGLTNLQLLSIINHPPRLLLACHTYSMGDCRSCETNACHNSGQDNCKVFHG